MSALRRKTGRGVNVEQGGSSGQSDRWNTQKEESASIDLYLLKTKPDAQKSWLTSLPLHTQVISHGTQRRPPSPMSRSRSRRSTLFTTVGTWPALSFCCFSSSLSCLWPPWPYSTSYWTVAAVPKGRHISSYRRRVRQAVASS